MRKTASLIRKIAALFLAVCLSLESSPAVAQTQKPVFVRTGTTPAALEGVESGLQAESFPGELGRVSEVFQTAQKQNPRVILVQDAHAVPEAQHSIGQLIHYFEKNSGLSWVGAEGASENLDPLLLSTFPDKKTLEETLDFYLSGGEISGVVKAAVMGSNQTLYSGVEDSALYEEDIQAFLDTISQRAKFEKELASMREILENIRDRWYSKEKIRLERKREAFLLGQGDLFEYLRAMSFFQEQLPEDFPKTHPLVSGLLSLVQDESETARYQAHLEIKALSESLERQIRGYQEKAEYYRKKQLYETEQIVSEEFLDYLFNLSQKQETEITITESLRRRVSAYRRVQNAEGEDLSRELENLEVMLRNKQGESQPDKRLREAAERIMLLEKTLALGISHEEWLKVKKLQAQKNESSREISDERLELLEEKLRELIPVLTLTKQPWMRFYEKAIAREEAMWQRLEPRLDARANAPALLVTGGFHREGLSRKFREKKIPFWVVTPAISSLPDEDTYTRHMQGEVSWKEEFRMANGRVSVFEAFHRHAFERLIRTSEELGGFGQTNFILRRWRENILRELAAQGRLTEASRYTRYLDEWSLERMDASKRETLFQKWTERVENFSDAIEKMNAQKNLNFESLSAFFSKPAAVSWNAVTVISRETVPARWVSSQEQVFSNPQAESEESSVTFEEPEIVASEQELPAVQEIENPENVFLPFTIAGFSGLSRVVNLSFSQTAERPELRAVSEKRVREFREELAALPSGMEVSVRAILADERQKYKVPEERFSEQEIRNVLKEEGFRPKSRKKKEDVYITPKRAELRVTEARIQEALSKPQAAKLKIAINLKDAGAHYRDGVLNYEDSLRKVKNLLPLLRSQGAGSVYLYGGLYEMGGVAYRVHRGRPDGRAEYIFERDGKTLVKIENYPTKKTEYSVPASDAEDYEKLTVEDGHNPFSILSLLKFNPQLSADAARAGSSQATLEQLREVIETAHALGMKVTLDFIPWMAPDGIDESNYLWTFYRELSEDENKYFRELPETSETQDSKEKFLKRKVDENPSYFTVRLKEENREERVILVRHLVSDMGGVNVDQAVLNPFLPQVRDYYKAAMNSLSDLGADELRVDLGHVYLREYIADSARGYFSDAYWQSIPEALRQTLEEALQTIDEPWREIIQDAKEHALNKGRELRFVMEAYDPAHLVKLTALGSDQTYYADVFKNLVRVARGESAMVLDGALRHAVGNRGRAKIFPSNFDQFPLVAMGGAQNAIKVLLLTLAHLKLDVMWDLRDWIGFSGQVFPMVGGDQNVDGESNHAFANQKEFEKTLDPGVFYNTVETTETAEALKKLLDEIGTQDERYIEFLDNARRDQFITLGWETENGSWRILAVNLHPERGTQLDFIELPRHALIASGSRFFKVREIKTGRNLEIEDYQFHLKNVSVSGDQQYALFELYRELPDEAIALSPEGRFELRSQSEETPESNSEGKALLEKLFQRRVLDDETKALLKTLLPKPLLEQYQIDFDTTPWVTHGDSYRSPVEYVFRVSFQDPEILVLSLAPAMPGPLGLNKEALVYLPLQNLGDGYLGILQHGRVQKIENYLGKNEETKRYAENPFRYWLEENLDSFAEKTSVQGALLAPLALTPDDMEKLGFKRTKDESLWYRKTGARAELRTKEKIDASIFGRGSALSADYLIVSDSMSQEDFDRLFKAISARVEVLEKSDSAAAKTARDILKHLERMQAEKSIAVFVEQRWAHDSYLTAGAGPSKILFGKGFFSAPTLAEEAFFRIAERSFQMAQKQNPETLTISRKLYGEDKDFEIAHQGFVELRDEAVLRAAVENFNAFSPGSALHGTKKLFEAWLKHDLENFKENQKYPTHPDLEQAGYLASVLRSRGWDQLPPDPQDPEAVLAADPVKAKAFFEILYPLYTFGQYRYQFLRHAWAFRNVFMKSLRKTVEDIDAQLRAKIAKTPEIMRGSRLRPIAIIDYLAEMAYSFSNDLGIPEELIFKIPAPLIDGYQRNVAHPERIIEKNSTLIDFVIWDLYEKVVRQKSKEIYPAWDLYADLNVPEAPSGRVFKTQGKEYHDLTYRIVRAPKAWQEGWLDDRFSFEKTEDEDKRKIFIPGYDKATVSDLYDFTRRASSYVWKGFAAHLNNLHPEFSGAQLSLKNKRFSSQHPRFEIVTLSGSPVAAFWQQPSRIYYHLKKAEEEDAADFLFVVRDESHLWSELLVWTDKVTAAHHYTDQELPYVLPLLGFVRRSLLKRVAPEGPFNFEGADVQEWVEGILSLHDLVEVRFWELVVNQYGNFEHFFREEETTQTEQNLFWYYSLFRHPKGLFAELAEKLEQVEGSKRLTDESAAFVLDALYAILWGGPYRESLPQGNRWILGKLLHYFYFHPDGVSVPDFAALQEFLKQEIASEGTTLDETDFTEWLSRAHAKYRSFSETGALVEAVDMENPEADGAQAQMRAFLNEPRDHQFDPENFPAENLLFPEKHPWQNHATREAIWLGTYKDGLSLPGTRFKLRFPAGLVKEGALLRVTVRPTEDFKSWVLDIHHEENLETPPLARLALSEAVRDSYNRGQEQGQAWERVPDFEKIFPTEENSVFAELETDESGFLILRHNGYSAALHVPSVAGISQRRLRIQYQEGLISFYTPEAEYLGAVSFPAGNRQALSNSERIKVLAPIQVPLEGPQPKSLSEYANLLALTTELRPLMEKGRGYDRLVITERHEGEAGLQDRAFVLPHRALEDVSSAAESIRTLLENRDPLYRLRRLLSNLEKDEESGAYFEESYVFPEVPEKEEFNSLWKESSYHKYEDVYEKVTEQRRVMIALRELDRFRVGNRDFMGTYWSQPGAFRKAAASLLKQTDTSFRFLAKGVDFRNLKNLSEMEYQHAESARKRSQTFLPLLGLGVATPEHFHLFGGSLRLGKSPNPDAATYFFIRTIKEKQEVVQVFDMETGRHLDEAERIFRELEAKTREAEFSLTEALAAVSERGQRLHLNRIAYELNSFMETVEVQDEIAAQRLRLELMGKLQQLLPSLIKSKHSEVNTAALILLLRELAAAGPENVLNQADLFLKEFGRRSDEPTFYFSVYLEMYQESFGLNPEDQGQDFGERFYDFFENAFLPEANRYSAETSHTQLIHTDSFYEVVLERLSNHQSDLQTKIGEYVESLSLETKRRGVIAAERGFQEAYAAEHGALSESTLFFIRKIFNDLELMEREISEEEAAERATYVTPYGGVEGIGASSALIEYRGKDQTETDAVIVDAGVKIDNQNTPPRWPEEFSVKPKAVFLTHAHLDHVGAAIELWEKLDRSVPFYVTPGTRDILGRVLEFMGAPAREAESASLTKHSPETLDAFLQSVRVLKLNQWYAVSPKMKVYFHGPAGHLHGAASVVVSTPDGTTFLSGDVSAGAQGPVPGFLEVPKKIAENIDQAQIESTYGMLERKPEVQQEARLVQAVAERLSVDGRVLIPAFANGRSQRVLLLLLQNFEKLKKPTADLKIYIDGQAAVFTDIYLKAYPEVFKPYQELIQRNVVLILGDSYQERGRLRSELEERDGNQQTIIIASAGNASQGRSRYWATRLANDSRSGIFFTGYMDPQEVGSQLLSAAQEGREEFYFGSDIGLLPLLAKVEEFKLSGHASGAEIMDDVLGPMSDNLRRVWIGHGGSRQSQEVYEWIRRNHPEWNPQVLRNLQRQQGFVLRTQSGLQAKQEFFESLDAEALYEVIPDAQELPPAPVPAVQTPDEILPIPEVEIEAELEEVLPEKSAPLTVAEPELELKTENDRLTKASRQALLARRLKEVPDLKPAEAVLWLRKEVINWGLEAKAGTFSETTIRTDLKEIRSRQELRVHDRNGWGLGGGGLSASVKSYKTFLTEGLEAQGFSAEESEALGNALVRIRRQSAESRMELFGNQEEIEKLLAYRNDFDLKGFGGRIAKEKERYKQKKDAKEKHLFSDKTIYQLLYQKLLPLSQVEEFIGLGLSKVIAVRVVMQWRNPKEAWEEVLKPIRDDLVESGLSKSTATQVVTTWKNPKKTWEEILKPTRDELVESGLSKSVATRIVTEWENPKETWEEELKPIRDELVESGLSKSTATVLVTGWSNPKEIWEEELKPIRDKLVESGLSKSIATRVVTIWKNPKKTWEEVLKPIRDDLVESGLSKSTAAVLVTGWSNPKEIWEEELKPIRDELVASGLSKADAVFVVTGWSNPRVKLEAVNEVMPAVKKATGLIESEARTFVLKNSLEALKTKLQDTYGLSEQSALEILAPLAKHEADSRQELREESIALEKEGDETPAELEQTFQPLLTGLADPKQLPDAAALKRFVDFVQSAGVDTARRMLETEAFANPVYLHILAGDYEGDETLMERVQSEAIFRAAHPSADSDLEVFIESLIRGFDADAAQFFEATPEGTLHYSFAFPLAGSDKVAEGFLKYAEAVRVIKNRYPGKVEADLRLLVTREEALDESRKDFFRSLGRTGLVKTIEVSSVQAAEMLLTRFLDKNGNALVYGAEGLSFSNSYASRRVSSAVDAGKAFPVALLLTQKLARVPGKIPADLLGRLTRELPEGMLTFNGTNLEITTLAMELMYRFAAQRQLDIAA